MHSIRIGVNVRFKNPPGFKEPWDTVYRNNLAYAARADTLGFDGIWVPEHHCTEQGYDPTPLVALAALSQVTKNCFLGTAPLLLPLRNPVLTAEEVATVDVLSGGRMMLGMGVGYLESDFDAIGIPRKERGARMDEALQIICKALWGEEPFDHEGRFYKHKGVQLAPRPLQKQIRVELAVRSEAAAKRVALPGINVNLNSLTVVQSVGPVVAEIASRAGRAPSSVGATILFTGFLAENEDAGRQAVAQYNDEDAKQYLEYWAHSKDAVDRVLSAQYKEASRTGVARGSFTPQSFVDGIHEAIETITATGLRPDWINLNLWPSGMPYAEALECLERVAADVLPKIPRVGRHTTE